MRSSPTSYLLGILVVASALNLTACSNDNSQNKSASPVRSPIEGSEHTSSRFDLSDTKQVTVVAKFGDDLLTQTELDNSIGLKLYDLDWAKYELRVAALTKQIDLRMQNDPGKPVELLIQPPIPPRLELPASNRPVMGSASAPVVLSVFCSYQSSHCARMMIVYDELSAHYGDLLTFQYYDFPQAFHRQAFGASRAARCAESSGQFEPYQKGLYAQFDNLNDALYKRMARQVNISEDAFRACLSNEQMKDAVNADLELANRLGFSQVPVTLVNGLYLSGPKSVDILRFFIDYELNRLNIDHEGKLQMAKKSKPNKLSSPGDLPLTQLPLRLEGIIEGTQGNSRATIHNLTLSESDLYSLEDEILPGVRLVHIASDIVVIDNQGARERLTLMAGNTSPSSEDVVALNGESAQEGAENISSPDYDDASEADIPAGLEYTYRGVVEAMGETPLSRSWIQDQLLSEQSLRTHFEPAELEVEGVHVVRLTNVESSEFYQTLGLKDGDVVLRVNDEWVHETQNTLFSELETANLVSVVLMRRGLPVHLKYSINEGS